MAGAGDFNIWWGLLGLAPLIIYLILVFRDMDPLPATLIAVIFGAFMTGQNLISMGNVLAKAMGSFLALVGLIIMLGRGLGEVLTETKASHTIVHKIIYGIGIDTEKKAMLGIMLSCIVVVGLLGTMAGGNAILAPIVVSIAASVGLTKSVVGIMFQAAAEEALIIGPFTPPMVTVMGLLHMSYIDVLLKISLPIALVTWICTWFMIQRIQKETKGKTDYEEQWRVGLDEFAPTKESIKATYTFLALFLIAIIYGIVVKAGTNFVIVVMLILALATGYAGGLKTDKIFKLIVKGMAGNVGLFLLFLLLEPFINFVEQAGGFKAISILLMPLIEVGGKAAVVISGGLLGAFGISGATVAELKMLDSMFQPSVIKYGVSIAAWGVAMVVATRVTNFIYPGSNMISSMGYAESTDMKSMIKNGVVIAVAQTIFLIIYAYSFA